MSDKWSTLCHATTCFCIWFLLGYSVFAIACASYGVGHAKGSQCRRYLDDAIWLPNHHSTGAFCDYLLSNNKNHGNNDDDGSGIDTTTTAVKARCLAAIEENRVANAVAKMAGESKFSTSMVFARPSLRTGTFWAGVGLFACYWVLFGFVLGSMAVEEVCGDSFGVGDELGERDRVEKRVDVEEGRSGLKGTIGLN